ncbi:hypothetical protein C5C82_15005 [Rathayibacter sp. AY1D5]|nr:hypothetical protein C5C82_15005 [Rathayibacter sp. AY1D5]PPI05306.1 hypothetical protein C5C63_14285 [Rathayibacter sp. AY1B8]
MGSGTVGSVGSGTVGSAARGAVGSAGVGTARTAALARSGAVSRPETREPVGPSTDRTSS